jgi:hypothetical protein
MKVATREVRRAFGLGEFAAMFSISRDTAKRLATAGSLRTIMVGGRRLVPIGEVERIERDGLSTARIRRFDQIPDILQKKGK